ncbi:hypothetical protein Ancab_017488 [Ancistrocladus abbreviatus]
MEDVLEVNNQEGIAKEENSLACWAIEVSYAESPKDEEEFELASYHLTIPSLPSGTLTLEMVTRVYPQKNTSSRGLHRTIGSFITHCAGMFSCGSLSGQGGFEGSRQFIIWEDPFKKPCKRRIKGDFSIRGLVALQVVVFLQFVRLHWDRRKTLSWKKVECLGLFIIGIGESKGSVCPENRIQEE